MKTKWILRIVAVLMIVLIFSISQGVDRFYYGTYGGRPDVDFSSQRDTLKFNINYYNDVDASNIDYWKENQLRVIVGNTGEDEYPNSPGTWASKSHYTMWEAEGLEGSYYKLNYNGGTLVNDPDASGGEAMKFAGPGTPDTIQTGPTYYQEPEYGPEQPIECTAEFRLKYLLSTPLGPMGPGPPPTLKVCCLIVVDTYNDTILKDTNLYKSDFAHVVGYKTFKLEYHTLPDWNHMQFQIYWFGIAGALYIDYVKVYDDNGKILISGFQDSLIMDHVSQDWVDTTVYRWYLRDEPTSIDLFATSRYVDSLIREVSQERPGMQVLSYYLDTTFVHEYFLRHDPVEYHIDPYPTRWWGLDSSGEQFQQSVDTPDLNTASVLFLNYPSNK